ncbi:MAG: hypothetical protein JNK82_31780 [Myxococcaceae bacterium]|nr:hypothetical protein [Myxococcaceae bacterium]
MPAPTLLALLLTAAPLDVARKAVEELRCPEAFAALDELDAATGLNIADNVARLELRAVCLGVQKKPQAAEKVFRELVWVSPGAKISDEYGPRVRTPFLEARAFIEEQAGLSAREVTLDETKTHLTFPRDPLNLIARIEVRWRRGAEELVFEPKLPATEAPAPWKPGEATAAVARIYGAKSRLISTVELDPKLPPAPAAAVVEPAPAPQSPRFRPAMWSFFALAAVSLGTGIAFDVRSYDADRALGSAQRDGEGRITNLDQRDAFALEQRVKTDAAVRTGLYVTAGVFAVVALVLAIAGAP